MNKKLLAIIGILVILVVAMGGYILGKDKPSVENQATVSKSVSKSTTSSSSSPAKASSSEVIISTTDAESQLNNGQSIDGKTVDVELFDVVNASELGQNLQAGEHLNFYPATQQYNLKAGDHVKFKVAAVKSELGSWFIKGDVIK